LNRGAPGGSGPQDEGARDPGTSGVSEGFEDALEKLEGLVAGLEQGDLSLEETIRRFEEGQRLLRICSERLRTAELRVREILGRADGSLDEQDLKGDEDEGR